MLIRGNNFFFEEKLYEDLMERYMPNKFIVDGRPIWWDNMDVSYSSTQYFADMDVLSSVNYAPVVKSIKVTVNDYQNVIVEVETEIKRY